MPKLIVQRKKTKKNVPAQHYTVPTSPWQKLIYAAMQKLRLTGRNVAAALTLAGAKTSQSTLWTWLHHPNGYPHPRSYRTAHAQALSTVLRIPLAEIHQAHDASMHRYTPKSDPVPQATKDALATLEETIAASTQTYIKRTRVLHLIQLIRRGCEPAPSPAPH